MVLRLTWRCGERGNAVYKAGDPVTDIGCQVNHLWDDERKFFYRYEAFVGRTGRSQFRFIVTFQTLGASLQACEAQLNWSLPVRR
jgi:hypothetical protein